MIKFAHKRGGHVHIWVWGNDQPSWSSKRFADLTNGTVDRRLQRYAARLGPLPGWTMGYGFDLHEWVDKAQLQSLADYLNWHMGWKHMLGTRGINLQSSHTFNSYSSNARLSEELSPATSTF